MKMRGRIKKKNSQKKRKVKASHNVEKDNTLDELSSAGGLYHARDNPVSIFWF